MTMKNADIPAMPQSATSEGYSCDYYDYGGPGIPTGLTKREMMAMHALQGLLAAPDLNTIEPDAVAGTAIAYVDALLAELDRTSK